MIRRQPDDTLHEMALDRALASLAGLSVGDAFGERFFIPDPEAAIAARRLPPAPWPVTDDTIMALSVVEVLRHRRRIDQDLLARRFADRYRDDPTRGYGRAAHEVLQGIGQGRQWSLMAGSQFGGQGSCGNGGAMRVAPLGAYFADDLDAAAENAALSAAVTHAHPEGKAGAVAVAVAAAWAWNRGQADDESSPVGIYETVLARTPPGETREGITRARTLPSGSSVDDAVALLGNGSRVTAQDTVPLCIWLADRHPDDYAVALWSTVSALGDRDTTCAIVGGIVAASTGWNGIPREWLEARGPLRY